MLLFTRFFISYFAHTVRFISPLAISSEGILRIQKGDCNQEKVSEANT